MSIPEQIHHYQNAVMNSSRWENFEPREDDILITTSYKAGTTWMQGICAALVFQQPQPSVAQDELTPWLDANFAPIEDVLAQLDALANRRYIKTHAPLDGIRYYDKVKYIFVGRDGKDVFMSMWSHWNNMRPSGYHLHGARIFTMKEMQASAEAYSPLVCMADRPVCE